MDSIMTVARDDLFVVRMVGQEQPEFKANWMITFRVDNEGVDPSWFFQCMKTCFGEDKNLIKLQVNTVVLSLSEKVEDKKAFCEAKAEELLNVLKKHPLWGKKDGPDLDDDFHTLD